MNVLVVAPHPDDEVLGCGGTIARHVAEGDTVSVVIVTKGDDRYDPAWVARSQAEAREAHNLLGVSGTAFFDLPSPTLDMMPFADVVDALRPFLNLDVVYIPARNDLHQEHRIVHEAACVAFRPPGPDLYAYETLSETECGFGFQPNHFVDITDYLARKVEALACYATQLQDDSSPRSLLGCSVLAWHRGLTIHREAAEAFETVRTVW